MLIDSHCHLDDSSFDTDRLQVIDYAQQNGVQIQIIPAIDIFSSTHPHGNSSFFSQLGKGFMLPRAGVGASEN